ncbi:glycosyltransferase involved in cell wall biosynthesis [Herbaspirillum sp. Sphag1AN]|uniref:glycosyltransferase family 4 protein n=1 Tax=unclassified Herbaspirillum TaxID=2624150 RepID=UPI00160AF7AE|nr:MULTISPECIES: glycosyltransferase family 4 protein [unclassified Herbaspirillum]MBB3212975.1 glycosyltransferase involved in cell wall biosynthesis [Herbaspirillum sp. Sphag1AN]MBB3246172.1 glycosyltransferase involved in cell wall biosynthesis [Herbaspirillum sp. Sphag64]
MKVLIVSQYFQPESFRINDVVKSLVEKGVEVDVLTGKPNYPDGDYFQGYRGWGCQREQWAGANIYRVPLAARGKRSALKLIFNYLSFIAAGCLFGPWLLRRRRYDAIFVYATSPLLQAIPALFLGFLKRSKVLVWVQDLWPDSLAATGYVRNAVALKCVEYIVRLIYRHADLLLVQSEAFKQNVRKLAPGKPIVYYPNSVDRIFSSGDDGELPQLPFPYNGFTVVFAGNVGSGQAVEVIVGAADLLRGRQDISFVVFGKGSRWDWMESQVRELGLTNVYLPGRFPVEMMPGVMSKASVLLVTLADEAIFAATVPNKVQAYMAVGKPIIASLNGEGARLVAEAGAGLAVPAEDSTALAAAVLQLVEMTDAEREQMGENGRAFFKQHFDHDKLIDRLITHFSD